MADAEAELRFLTAAFGATITTIQRNADDSVMHAELTIGNAQVMLGQAGDQWKPREAALYVWVADCDATYQKALDAGAVSESAPRGGQQEGPAGTARIRDALTALTDAG